MPSRSRRGFLKTVLISLAGIGAGAGLLSSWLGKRPALPADLAVLRAQLPALPNAGLIADAYLSQAPDEADPRADAAPLPTA